LVGVPNLLIAGCTSAANLGTGDFLIFFMSSYQSDRCTKLEAYNFGREVYQWLDKNGFDLSGLKTRVYTCYNGDFRIYDKPMEVENSRSTFRKEKMELDENGNTVGWHGTRGNHTRMISNYIAINRDEWEDIKKAFHDKDLFWEDLIFKKIPRKNA